MKHNSRTLHGKLCKNYIISNGYCINQYSLMQEKENKIKILNIRKNLGLTHYYHYLKLFGSLHRYVLKKKL